MKLLILCNGKLIDGTGRDPVDNVSIVIEGNRIKSVGPSIIYPGEKNTVDLTGLTVMPGLIDCHLHLGGLTVDQPRRAIGRVSFKDTMD